MLIFIWPLALAVVGTGYFTFFTEENWKWKGLMILILATSLVTQFVVPLHFLIPLLLQVAIGLWTIIYWKLDR